MITLYTLSPYKPELKGVIRDIRVAWTLEELGEKYELKIMDPLKKEHKTEAYKKLNPFGKVPTIVDGDLTLFESSAICTYLADKRKKLIPGPGTRERVIYDQWLSFAVSTFEPQAMKVFGFDFFMEKDPIKQTMRQDSLKIVDGLLETIDSELAKRPYLSGDEFSVADIIFSSICRAVNHTEVTAKHARVHTYLTKNYERPAFVRARSNHG